MINLATLPVGLFLITSTIIGFSSDIQSKEVNKNTWLCNNDASLSYNINKWKLSVNIETPTPGYEYSFEKINNNNYEIRLFNNQKIAAMVIDSIFIEETIQEPDPDKDVLLRIVKTFGWGANEIVCKLQ